VSGDEVDKVRRKLARKYGLPDDVAAALHPATAEVMEEEAVRWAVALKTGTPVPANTETMLALAKEAGAERMVRLLSPDRNAPADNVPTEAIEAATNAAELAALDRRCRVDADKLRLIHPTRTSERDVLSTSTDTGRVADKETVAKLVEESRQRAEQPDAERGGWREVSGDE
jgi:hypothetical protein